MLQPKPITETAQPIIELRGISKTFSSGGEPVVVLENLDLEIPQGAFEVFMGPSGSGKSTLLNLIAGLDRPSSGQIVVAGATLTGMSERDLAKFRALHVGFVFQSYNLMPVLTALENVELPLMLKRLSANERRQRAKTALRVVGLEQRMGHLPAQLSGGQEQRVAIARAIVNDPTLLICDEPTGDLDRKAADEIIDLLERLNKELGKTIVVVTHDPEVAKSATVTRRLDKGQLR
jgi:putative ABC transport system ATP-binding protein